MTGSKGGQTNPSAQDLSRFQDGVNGFSRLYIA
jgi:hypothetical protein